MNPDASTVPARNWSRFLHRLWLVVGGLLFVGVAGVSFGEWWSKAPDNHTYEFRDRCDAHRQARMENRPTPTPHSVLARDFDFFGPDSNCTSAAREIDASNARFRKALLITALFGVLPPLVVLLVGHGIAWSLRGLRGDG